MRGLRFLPLPPYQRIYQTVIVPPQSHALDICCGGVVDILAVVVRLEEAEVPGGLARLP